MTTDDRKGTVREPKGHARQTNNSDSAAKSIFAARSMHDWLGAADRGNRERAGCR
jgi:hypothetical protein